MRWRYWHWFVVGLSGKPGAAKFLDAWLLLHVIIAGLLTHCVVMPLKDQAQTLVLPLAGVFVGLTFAWSGNAQALMQSDELAAMFDKNADGLENYVYTFQTAVLCLLTTIVGWGLAGLEIFNHLPFPPSHHYGVIQFSLFFLSSLSVRECWHVIIGSQFFVLAQREIRKSHKNDIA